MNTRIYTPEKLLAEAVIATQHAYAPYSGFSVGAALQTADGRIFHGCNVENAAYSLTLCAERAAICAAVSAGQRSFAALAVVADAPDGKPSTRPPYPCGACRQVLSEFCDDDFPTYVATTGQLDMFERRCLSDLLPSPFSL